MVAMRKTGEPLRFNYDWDNLLCGWCVTSTVCQFPSWLCSWRRCVARTVLLFRCRGGSVNVSRIDEWAKGTPRHKTEALAQQLGTPSTVIGEREILLHRVELGTGCRGVVPPVARLDGAALSEEGDGHGDLCEG